MSKPQDSLRKKLQRFGQLPPSERSSVLRAMALLPFTRIGLRVMGFRWCKEFIEHLVAQERHDPTLDAAIQFEMATRLTRAVRSAELHGPATPNCLERSMVLWFLLRRSGIGGELHIGARKIGPRFEAHAWVELNGEVLNDSADVHQHYSRFDAPIATAAADSPAAGAAESN
jgi:hypothetical protein